MTSKSQFTPGPWAVSKPRDNGDYSTDDVMTTENPPRRICNVFGGIDSPCGLSNANLIAAAPELLSALNSLLSSANACRREGTLIYLTDETVKRARSAIEKAIGKP
jgi:hypothetical protein